MIPASYKPKKKFMHLAIAEAKRARDRGDYPIGAVITRLTGRREAVIASAGNRVKTSGVEYQACRAGNAQICFKRLWPLPARLRALLHARTLCHVCRRLRVV